MSDKPIIDQKSGRQKKSITPSVAKQIKIAQDKVVKGLTIAATAKLHNCSVAQVKNYAAKYEAGKYNELDNNATEAKIAKAMEDMEGQTIPEVLNEMLREIIATIRVTESDPAKQAQTIQKISASFKQLEQSSVALQVKSYDADILCLMMRYIQPDLTNSQIIELFHRAEAEYKESKKR